MDLEDETLLSNIFKDAFSEDIRRDPEFAIYLSELSSLGLDSLTNEPSRLEKERSSIRDQTQDLAFHNYRTFIETADCSKGICQDFTKINSHLDGVLETLPTLSDKCNSFLKLSQEISTKRKANWLTLNRHNDLLELLEIPQLMETCVRNNYYDEALELITYVNRLSKKHSSTIPVIQNIVKDVDQATQRMLKLLIQQLRGQIGLPQCLRTIGHLRRLDCFSETELRIKFLQCRDIWLQQVIDQVPTADPQNHLTKIIEVYRVHLFDIITQYKAIFSDDDQFNLYSHRNDDDLYDEDEEDLIDANGNKIKSTPENNKPAESALFYNWVTEKIGQFLEILQMDLIKGGCAFDTVLSQCMYFGLSFSRVGADFRPLMVPIILNSIENRFSTCCLRAKDQLKQTLGIFRISDIQDHGHSSLISDEKYKTQQSTNSQPPLEIASLGPLALFCNSLVNAMNDLRSCCPANLAKFIGTEINNTMLAAAELIKDWVNEKHMEYEMRLAVLKNDALEGGDATTANSNLSAAQEATNSFNKNNNINPKDIENLDYNAQKNIYKNNVLSAARRMSTALESLILFMQKVLSAFFPSNQLCNKLGCSTNDLIAMTVGRLNPTECIRPLVDYLPTDEDVILNVEKKVEVVEEVMAGQEVPETKEPAEEKAPKEPETVPENQETDSKPVEEPEKTPTEAENQQELSEPAMEPTKAETHNDQQAPQEEKSPHADPEPQPVEDFSTEPQPTGENSQGDPSQSTEATTADSQEEPAAESENQPATGNKNKKRKKKRR